MCCSSALNGSMTKQCFIQIIGQSWLFFYSGSNDKYMYDLHLVVYMLRGKEYQLYIINLRSCMQAKEILQTAVPLPLQNWSAFRMFLNMTDLKFS